MPSRKPTPGKRFGSDGYGLTVTGLDPRQAALLQAWLPGAEHVADLSWGIVGTTVLRMRHEGRDVVVKAGDAADRHIARELRAHREWLGPWHGSAPELLHGDADAKLLVTGYLPGELVEGRPEETDPGTYRQAGRLLAPLHEQAGTVDHGYERRMRERALGHPVPTHGDWQPRNWLVPDGVVAVIGLGRADLRPAHTDLCRLEVQQFRGRPDLDAAFVDGYGRDPRTQPGWRRELLREAIATAVWAFRGGDEAFERQGHRMITDALGG